MACWVFILSSVRLSGPERGREKMKRALGCLACLAMVLYPLFAGASPKAVIKDDRAVLSKPVFEGELVKGTFEVLNQGDEELQILKIVPG